MVSRVVKRVLSITVAFIVFGFIDNFLMVIFGNEIDAAFISIGVTNTMLAAGLGNTLSDAVGILSGRWVEKLVHIRLPIPDDGMLSKNQIIAAETFGVVVGCLIGLFPLLLI